MAENQNFKCTGNCLQCTPAQRAYCASQHAYSNMKVLDCIMGAINAMQGTLDEMNKKIEAIQNNEAEVFEPSAAEEKAESWTEHIIAQKGEGAEK